MKIKENLERLHSAATTNEHPLGFFKQLAEYLEYVFSEPSFKNEFDKQFAERRRLYEEIESLEKKTLQELKHVQSEFLALIKKSKIDIRSFNRYQTLSLNKDTDIFQEIEAYENGGITSNRFLSEDIERHVFDIAANLLLAGFKKQLRKYLATSDEYARYHSRINGSALFVTVGNEYGNFIFSHTLPERCQKVKQFERERILKPWGYFETLVQFNAAYKLATTNLDLLSPPEFGTEKQRWFGAAKERVKILSMAQELQRLADNNMDFFASVSQNFRNRKGEELKNLKQIELKSALDAAHNRLMLIQDNEHNADNIEPTKDIDEFTVKYNEINREVWINNFFISRPDFNGINEMFFSYVYSNPGRTIQRAEIEKEIGKPLDKNIADIVYQLGFTKNIKKAFFPGVRGKSAVYFRKNVSAKELLKEKINITILNKELDLIHSKRMNNT